MRLGRAEHGGDARTAVTDDEVRAALHAWPDLMRPRGPEDTPAYVRLGAREIDRSGRTYPYGYDDDTSDTSRVWERPFDIPELGRPGFSLTIRQFDGFPEGDDPPEVLVGWMERDEDAGLEPVAGAAQRDAQGAEGSGVERAAVRRRGKSCSGSSSEPQSAQVGGSSSA